MKLRDRWAAMKKYFAPSVAAPLQPIIGFPHGQWSKKMLQEMTQAMSMHGVTTAPKEEPNDPMTKALIVQTLEEIITKHPHVTMRRAINQAFEDGVTNDYELLEKLVALEKESFRPKSLTGTEIKIRTRSHLERFNDAQDAMNYAMRGLLDNAMVQNKIKLDQSAGCSDPADKSGSSSVK